MFANYELEEKVSTSALSEVFRARDPLMGRTVLVKRMAEEVKTREKVVRRFQREIRLAAQLSHPNLVAAYHAGCEDGTYYLVMEDIKGVDLAAKVKQDGPLDVAVAVDYVCQAANGLAYLHDQGVFHRNVKPASILLDGFECIHVTNMTLARVDEDSEIDSGGTDDLTRQGQLIGTTSYLAPEQAFDAHSADHRSDIYSLGCTFHYLLTGKPPYPEKDRAKKIAAHARGPIPSLCAVRGDVSERMDQVFQQMLAKLPDQRYQSMDEVSAALREALFGDGDSVTEGRRTFSWEMLFGGMFVGVIVGALTTIVLSLR